MEASEESPLLENRTSGWGTSSEGSPSSFEKTKLILILSGLALAVFVGALDETIVAVAAVPIVSDFDAFSLFSWVSVSYLVTLISVQPLYGSISNVLGRKGPILCAAFVFLLASAGCGWAPNMQFFIVARALSGMGAGGMTGLSFIIVADSFPLDERPKYQSILMSGFGAAAVLGPIIGGVFTEELTWRWCFWINLPIVGFTCIVLLAFLRVPRDEYKAPPNLSSRLRDIFLALGGIDWIGSALFAGTITCFILPISLGGDYWPWASAQVPVLLVVSVLSLVGFIGNEFTIKQEKALIPVRMMKSGYLVAAWANLFLYSVCFTSFLYYMPVWFQVVEHQNPTITGLLLLPFLLGLVVVGIIYAFLLQIAGRLLSALKRDERYRKRFILVTGAVLFLIGIILISTLADKLPIGGLLVILLVFGAGSGLVLQTNFIEAQAAVQSDDVAMANSLAVVFEYLGGAVGLTISGTITRQFLSRKISHIPNDLVSPNLLAKILQNPYLANDLPTAAARRAVRDAFAGSLMLTFQVLAAFAAAVLVVSVFFVGGRGVENVESGDVDGGCGDGFGD